MLSSLASIVESKEEGEIDAALSDDPGPGRNFYRYSLPASLLRRKRLNNSEFK